MKRMITGVLIGAVVATALTAAVVSGQDTSAREARDRVEIEALMWRYTRALDTNDGAAYAAAYTVDGQFGTGANATKGREALQKMVDALRTQRTAAEAKGETVRPLYHMEANSWIEFIDANHARHHAYYLTARAGGGQGVPPQVVAVGRSVDQLERVDGRWLIKVRDVAPSE